MERSRRPFAAAVLLFILGAAGLSRFSQNVRSVEAVGLSGSGAAIGAGFVLLVSGLAARTKP